MKNVLIFLSGATIGAIVGYKVAERKLNDKFNELRNKDIEDINRIRFEMLQEKKKNKKNDKKDNIYKSVNTSEENPIEYNNVRLRYSRDGEFIDEDEPMADEMETDMDHPYQIKPEEYAQTDNYECESWTYYKGNDTMVNFDGEPVVDYRQYIEHVLDNCLADDEDLDECYIRNEKLRVDYEILTTDQSYSE